MVKWFKRTNFYEEWKNNPIWLPSKISLLKITLIAISLFLLTQVGLENRFELPLPEFNLFKNTLVITYKSSILSNIVAIFSGVGAINVALVFFIAQSMIDRNDLDMGRVLLYESKIYILLVLDIFTYIILLYIQFNIFIYFIIIFEFAFLIYSITKTISLIIENVRLIDSKRSMYIDLLRKYLRQFITCEIRFSNYRSRFYELVNQIDYKNSFIRLDNYQISSSDNYINIYSNFEGVFIGYDKERILKLLNIIKKERNKILSIEFENKESFDINSKEIIPLVFLMPKILDNIKYDTLLVRIDRNLYENKEVQQEFKKNIKKLFLIEKNNNLNSAEYELRNLKQRCLTFLKEGKSDDYSRTLNIYIDLIKEIYKQFQLNNLRFDNKLAETYRNYPFTQLKSIEWIIEDVYSILKASFEANDEDIFYESISFPIKIMKLSIENNDHIIFQNFNEYSRLIYIKGYELKKTDKRKSDFLIDRSWRYIKELAEIYLMYNFEKSVLSIEDFKGYSQYIIRMFQDLVKQSYDFEDYSNYCVFIEKLLKIANENDFKSSIAEYGLENKESIFGTLVHECLFGVSSWIYHDIFKKNHATSNYSDFISSKLSSKLDRNTYNYLNASLNSDNWQWYLWEREKDEEEFEIKINSKLSHFYLTKLLENDLKNQNIISFINKLDEEKLKFLNSNMHYLRVELEKIKISNKDYLKDVIISEKITSIEGMFEKIVNKINNLENIKLRLTKLDNNRVEAFKINFINNYNNTLGVRDLILNNIKIERSNKKFQSSSSFGLSINRIFDKKAFINPEIFPNQIYIDFDEGFNIGEGFKTGENKAIINELISKSIKCSLESILIKIETLKNSNLPLVLNIINEKNLILENDVFDFNPDWSDKISKEIAMQFPKCDGELVIDGRFNIPVFNIYNKDMKSSILVFESKNLCKYMQTVPTLKNKKIQMNEHFEFRLFDYETNSSEFEKIINEKPEWLLEKGDLEKQIDYLKQKVIIQVIEIFEIIIDEKARIFSYSEEMN